MSLTKTEAARWSLARRIAFRFLFAYLILFGVPMVLGLSWEPAVLNRAFSRLEQSVLPWVGRHILRLHGDFPVQPTGSGDRTVDYIQLLCFLALAAVATLLWSVKDRRRPHYERLQRGLFVFIRYLLGTTMIIYGMSKVWKTQFPFP